MIITDRLAPITSTAVAYGRHDTGVQVFIGQDHLYEPAKAEFERILTDRPEKHLMLVFDGKNYFIN